MMHLRQSTASQAVLIGPFVDSTDGNTAETALTIANTDVRLSKNGANIVGKNSGGGTHDELGYYTVTLDATDTDTVGRLQLMVHVSGALPVYHEFEVLEEAVYDALYAAAAPGYGVAQSGDSYARLGAPALASVSADIANIVDITGTNQTLVAGIQSDTNDIQTRLPAALVGGRIDANAGAISGDTTAADNLEAALDGTGGVTITAALTGNVTGNLSGSVGSVTGNVGGNVVGSVGSLATQAKADVNAETTSAVSALLPADFNALAVDLTTGGVTVNALTVAGAAAVNAEVDAAIADARLDELLAADSDIDGAAPPTVGSVFHELMSKTAGSFTYDQTTDSLEALRDRGDAAWITAAGFSTHSAADVWAVATRVLTAATNISGPIADQVWEEAVADHSGTAGSTAAALAGASAPSAATVAAAVWDLSTTGHTTSGTFGAAVVAAGSAGDPWETSLPGAYAAGTAGYILGTNLDAAVSTRLATAGYTAPPSAAAVADAVWDEALAGHATAGTAGKAVSDALADTAELQGDWADGGRLDLLLDGVKTRTDFLPAATAGSDGGLLILGANTVAAGMSITATTGSALLLSTSAGAATNAALEIYATGSGATALKIQSDNGAAIDLESLSATGHGTVQVHSQSSWAFNIVGGAGSDAVNIAGDGAGAGLNITGGLSGGHAVKLARGSAAADDLHLVNSDAPTLSAAVLTAGAITAAVAPNLDAAVSTRSSHAAADVVTALGTGSTLTALATAAALTTLAGYVDTEVAAIKAKTDSLTFSVAGQVDANVRSVNDVALTGTGVEGDEWGPA